MQHSVLKTTLYQIIFVAYHAVRELVLHWFSLFFLSRRHVTPAKSNKRQYGILVTGTSTGIGNAIATTFIEKGYTVFAGVRKQEDANEWISKYGLKQVTPVILDTRDDKQVAQVFDQINNWVITGQGRRLFAVVNNAGVTDALPLEMMTNEKIEAVVETNFIGYVRVIKAFLPLLRESKGRIVNISSVHGFAAIPLLSMYSAAKYAVEGMSDSLRTELKPQDIFISLVEPGFIESAIFDKMEQQTCADSEEYHMFSESQKKFMVSSGKTSATSPFGVALAVAHAIESSFPNIRYLVGVDAFVFWILKMVLPEFMWDSMIYYALVWLTWSY